MGEGGKAVISRFAVTASTSLTALKPLYSLAIAKVNSRFFEIQFIVEMCWEPQSGPCDSKSARRDAV